MSATMRAKLTINAAEPVAGDIAVEQAWIDVTTSYGKTTPDLRWTYVDKNGHFHAYDHAGELPTLIVVRKRRKPLVYRCVACNKKVPTPATTTDYSRQMMPGRESWTLTVHGVVPDERFSFRFTAGEKEYFGFAERYATSAEGGMDGVCIQSECSAWPVSWRKADGAR